MALQEFQIAAKMDPKNVEIQSNLGYTYMIKGAYDLAERHYLRAVKYSDGMPKHLNNLGALYLTLGRYQKAADAFRSAAENLLFSNPERAWTGLGVATLKLGDADAAESYFKRAIQLNSNYFQPYYQLGLLYFAEERPEEAVTAFAKAVKASPRFIDGHFRLGVAYATTKQVDLARAAFREVLRLAPDSEQGQHASNYLNILQ